MKPRIFVSSTFYDLKYIREDLSNFIKAHDFDPIMFEDGDIGYTPWKELDSSCYETMKSADMVILIIGGNYGSRATNEDNGFENYLSVTRKEFQTALNSRIPIYTFVDSKVLTEYETFDLNLEALRSNPKSIKFKNTKDINVFYFIREIYQLGDLVVTSFERSDDIKEFLSKQWSDMFKKYLQFLKDDIQIKTLDKTIDGMKDVVGEMKIMLEGVGKKVLNEDTEEYKEIIEKQEKYKIEAMCGKIAFRNRFILRIENASSLTLEEKENYVSLLIDIYINAYTDDSIADREQYFDDKLTENNISIISHRPPSDVLEELKKNNELKERIVKNIAAEEYFDMLFFIN